MPGDGHSRTRGGKLNENLLNRSEVYQYSNDESIQQKQYTEDSQRFLQKNYWGLAYFTIQSTLLLVAWGVTCLIAKRPAPYMKYDTFLEPATRECSTLSEGSTTNYGCEGPLPLISASQLDAYDRLRYAIRVLGAVSAVLTVPLSSAICARAAVVYTQRRRDIKFRLRETLALADRGWWDPYILTQLFLPNGIGRYGSLFLLFCTAVCTLGMASLLVHQLGLHLH